MTRRIPTTPAAIALALVCTLATACGSGSGGGSSSSTGAASHRGGTLTMLWNATGSSIDPQIDYDQNWQLLVMTNDGLLAWKRVSGPQGNVLVPDLATSIPRPTDGGKTYLFHLRPGIRFSNGAPVKPTDVTATLEREFKAHGPGGGFYTTIAGGT
jgi:peptide/nickel transport system substrate-binding protein